MKTPPAPRTPSARHTWATTRYPYLVIRLAPEVYALRPLPSDLSRDVLVALAWSAMQACEGRLRMCMAFSWCEALYLESDGGAHESRFVPYGGTIIDFEPPCLAYLPSSELAA